MCFLDAASVRLGDGRRLSTFQNKMLRRMFGPAAEDDMMTEKVT